MPHPRRGWHGFCAALTAADAKNMPKWFFGINATIEKINNMGKSENSNVFSDYWTLHA